MARDDWNGCFQERVATEVSLLVRRYKEEPDLDVKKVLGDQLVEMFEELDMDYHIYAVLLQDIQSKYQCFI